MDAEEKDEYVLREDVQPEKGCVKWIVKKLELEGFLVQDPSVPEVFQPLRMFLCKPSCRRLFAYIGTTAHEEPTNDNQEEKDGAEDTPKAVHLSTQVPSVRVQRLMFFVKSLEDVVTEKDIRFVVQFGCLQDNALDSLLRVMEGVYAPSFLRNETWPESFRKEFAGQLHKFMASLTETTYHLKGNTVLYIPAEDTSDSELASKDKDLVQRLESALLHWNRQIKDVVNEKDTMDGSENAGPLDEIDFWRQRSADLSGIKDQLNSDDVKQIVEVLFKAKSTYLDSFRKLSSLIQRRSNEAQDNLKFLSTIEKSCQLLANATPKSISSLLPELLNRIRVIDSFSEFYGVPDRLAGLLKKVSNEIIKRCRDSISLECVFKGLIKESMSTLTECVKCGEYWKMIYRKNQDVMRKTRGKKWEIEESNVFAEVDAFVQRCRELLEICEGQIQFMRKSLYCKSDGEEGELPVFGGSKGQEIAKSLIDIEKGFIKQLATLQDLDYDILDVNATRWHDDYGNYKKGVKDLEVMFQNVVSGAFDGISSVAVGVSLLEAFLFLSRRETIRRAVEKQSTGVFVLFFNICNNVKREFDLRKKEPPLNPEHPKFSGAAMYAKTLMERIQNDFLLLENAHYIPRPRESIEATEAYDSLVGALREYMNKMYGDWIREVGNQDLPSLLEKSLMIRVEEDTGYLINNFAPELLRLFQEVHYWEKLNASGMYFEIPFAARDLAAKKPTLRVIRENISVVVREYNTILYLMAPWERKLFAEHVEYCDKRINQGILKLSWNSKGLVEFFVRECRRACRDVHVVVTKFQSCHSRIDKICQDISDTLLVKIERKRVYGEGEFESLQSEYRASVKTRLLSSFSEIIELLATSFAFFKDKRQDVVERWMEFIGHVDKKLEEAFRTTVRRSLQEISRTINGDRKSEVVPNFLVDVVLGTGGVEFKPSVAQLANTVNVVSKELITVITIVPRLEQKLVAEKSAEQNPDEPKDQSEPVSPKKVSFGARGSSDQRYYDAISNDDEILKVMVNIMTGMTNVQEAVGKYLFKWEKYKNVWSDKDAFIRRFSNMNCPLSRYEQEINKYRDLKSDIENEETTTVIEFLRVESGPLKHSLSVHCMQWETKFTELLNNVALKELNALFEYFCATSKQLRVPPKDLRELGKSIELVESVKGSEEKTKARFKPLFDQYKVLEKFDVAVKEEELERLAALDAAYESFLRTVAESERMLGQKKDHFKAELLQNLDQFSKSVSELRDEFTTRAPFDVVGTPEEANSIIEDFRSKLETKRKREEEIKAGLKIFEIDQPPFKEMAEMDKDIALLVEAWKMVEEWELSWNEWKTDQFSKLNVQRMEDSATRFLKRLLKLGREIKSWGVWSSLKNRVDKFRAMMPLILDLRNPAMRPRHWARLMDELGKEFNPESKTFTLDVVFDLGLDNFREVIALLSLEATKQLTIEQALENIEATWKQMNFEFVSYRKDYFLLKVSDELMNTLEDNQVSLSAMKASRCVAAFETQVYMWESTLSQISEMIELLLQVQRQWMYLENIFGGSEDIRKQLPSETMMFDGADKTWIFVVDHIRDLASVKNATETEGLFDKLTETNESLETIQKQLDNYLETKRQAFPRFYFLSNDDLLEILGQARDPRAVQRHLKKCFEAIQTLELVEREGGKGFLAAAMNSPEGEQVAFAQTLSIEPGVAVESWLLAVESNMRSTLKRQLKACMQSMKGTKRERWVREWPGQLIITATQLHWTAECTKALTELEGGSKNALRIIRQRKWGAYLKRYTEMVKGNLSKLDRKKLVALITIEVHARDVIERMIKSGTKSISDFEWLSQLRFVWDTTRDTCVAHQTTSQIDYDYEYLGNSGRLVITPLTDRCYMTLTTAMEFRRGGNPQGPAGTGKTETVKDLGKAIAKYVIVFNCSEGLDYRSLGRMFSGLAQTGAWSCLDEFNRIEVEVLSVVAQQIMCILSAIKQGVKSFVFEGRQIKLNLGCGIFVTMNPGYAGRSELPDNLKALLRPVSMMVPDFALIAEIMLYSEGFDSAKLLSRKIITLYSLMIQQLSKQDHYDFGLRAIKSVLVAAGSLKRMDSDTAEDLLLYRACRDANLPKLVSDDVHLFNDMLGDLFPGLESPSVDYGELQDAIVEEMKQAGLIQNEHMCFKALQLYETKETRHGVMLVGNSGSGKTTAWTILSNALCRLNKANVKDFERVRTFIINPKSVSIGELYGEYDLNTREWSDGVLSSVMRSACASERSDLKWIVLDGPVDTLWIESMNTVLDDNKMLTLISGERISLPRQVSLLFEVADLAVASPATVSRCGMVYFDVSDLGWWPYVESWLNKKGGNETTDEKVEGKDVKKELRGLFEKYVPNTLEFRRKKCTELVETSDMCAVQSLCRLFDPLWETEFGMSPSDEGYCTLLEMAFAFCVIWSIGATVDEESRHKMDIFIREIDPQFPSKDTVYEYYPDPKSRAWRPWEDKVPQAWRPQPNVPFHKVLVPTVDTVRSSYVTQSLVKGRQHVLMVGGSGVGKTAVIHSLLSALGESFVNLTVNFSAQTSSSALQKIIEGKVEKRTKGVYVPPAGKRMIVFVDDLNMPKLDTFGSQPPLELLRHWLNYGFWYDRQKQGKKHIMDVQLLGAMGPPGGGRNRVSLRLKSHFNVLNMTFPTETQIKKIFGTLINFKFAEFDEEVKPLGDIITQATVELYYSVVSELLPTPSKSHYLFNMRDISRVFEGILRAHRDFQDSRDSMVRLWVHECFRVFRDRLVCDEDRDWFSSQVNDKLGGLFATKLSQLFRNDTPPLFGDFMREGLGNPPYEEISDMSNLRQFLEDTLEEYNLSSGVIQMDLVLFSDAVEHVCRILRVLKLPRGNMLLVGVGGSGRQSLTRLAAHVAGFSVFTIEPKKNYRTLDFHEDLKRLYKMAAVERDPTVFFFNDSHVVNESFLEDINNMLSSGEVPGLFSQEEFGPIREEIRADASRDMVPDTYDDHFAYFIEKARSNIHIVLAMSPIGDAFRNRVRTFPSLVNAAVIDWYSEWPRDALSEVAQKFLDEGELVASDVVGPIGEMLVTIHSSVVEMSRRMFLELRRPNYVTPTNYLELVTGYLHILNEKQTHIGELAEKLQHGLQKLEDTAKQVSEMKVDLEEKKRIVAKRQKECEDLLVVIVQEKRIVDEQEKDVKAEEAKISKEKDSATKLANEAQADLEKAMPALAAAQEALAKLSKGDVSEVRAYGKPPPEVQTTLSAVMVTLKKQPSWDEAKRVMGDPHFLSHLVNFNKATLTDALISKISKFTSKPDFTPENVEKVSKAAAGMCMWVHAIEQYGRVQKVVQPRKMKVQAAMDELQTKESQLEESRKRLEEISRKVQDLKDQYEGSMKDKETLRKEAEETEMRLSRAEKLVNGLSGERERWQKSIQDYKLDLKNLVGDVLLASGIVSYCGPFTSEYRYILLKKEWSPKIRSLKIPLSSNFELPEFLANSTDVREWNIQGLPTDAFSTENGVLVTRGRRWPLMIDPQGQANKWVKNLEKSNELTVTDLKSDFVRCLESAVPFGIPVLIQDVEEELDPALEPILSKAIVKTGNRQVVRLGDKDIDYNGDFRLYLTTKLANPHYAPEISTKTTLVNFSVKEQGLEDQLLGIVVRKERPDLEEQKDELVVNVAGARRKMVELEDEILRLLSEARGSLLDNEQLIMTLQSSKNTAEEIKSQLEVSEQTEIKIDAAREQYRPCAARASILYFVLNDLSFVDPMYQFALDSYISLFNLSIDKSMKSEDVNARLRALNEYHTYSVYRNTCLGLFEKDKLLLAFQMCVKILEHAKKINTEEYAFFIRGGQVMDKDAQPPNPCEWLSSEGWDNIYELDKLTNFHNIAQSFEQLSSDWYEWYLSTEPEATPLPAEWEGKMNELQRMVMVRCLRPDRVIFMVTNFVINNKQLGHKFVDPPVADIGKIAMDTSPHMPLIFVLSPGVDPTNQLAELAKKKGVEMEILALGQGQDVRAQILIENGVRNGSWVFLANCHLMISWMPRLEKIVESLGSSKLHKDFRLWLSSDPHPKFPISILQKGVKITTEPPRGIKNNMVRLYSQVSEEDFQSSKKPDRYKKLLVALCFYHAVLVERKKFGTLGMVIPYDFNDSDFRISENILRRYVDEYKETPWQQLRYLISEATYGGRVTDSFDRRILNVYISQLFCDDALSVEKFRLSPLSTYFIPKDGTLQSYSDALATLPSVDKPEAFGQHSNADVSSQIQEANNLLQTLLSLQPRIITGVGGKSDEENVLELATSLEEHVPEDIDMYIVKEARADEPSALNTVLFQEIARYNSLLATLRSSLAELKRAIRGLIIMNPYLESLFDYLREHRVPHQWQKIYPSSKPLASWMRDLDERISQLRQWGEVSQPKVFWLGGLTFPDGFLMAVMQNTARKLGVGIDSLTWEFSIVNLDESVILQSPKDGVYVKGVFLEGAGWDNERNCLCEPRPMQLLVNMPIIHFRAIESKRKAHRGVYSAPMYIYPVRTGTRERPSFVISVDLKTGDNPQDYWIKRGTALLLSTSS